MIDYEILVLLIILFLPIVFCCFYCVCVVKKNEGYIMALHNQPVLREYIKEYVPIDNSEEAKKVIKEKMVKAEMEMTKAFNLSADVREDTFKTEELV